MRRPAAAELRGDEEGRLRPSLDARLHVALPGGTPGFKIRTWFRWCLAHFKAFELTLGLLSISSFWCAQSAFYGVWGGVEAAESGLPVTREVARAGLDARLHVRSGAPSSISLGCSRASERVVGSAPNDYRGPQLAL